VVEKIGGASRDRTDDLIVANDALSQLSYSPLCGLGWSTAEVFYQRSRIGTNRTGAWRRVTTCTSQPTKSP
jgi:hypothetical protein